VRGLVLAAGFGTRLRPITDRVPKAMLPVCGTPLLEHTLKLFVSQGFGPIIVNTHHLHEQIAAYVKSCRMPVSVSHESDRIRGTGGALWHARDFLAQSDEFFVCNVEPLKMLQLRAMVDDFREQRLDAGLVSVPTSAGGTIASDPVSASYLGTRQHDIDWSHAAQSFYVGVAFYTRRFLDLLTEEDFSIVPVWRRAQDAGMRVAVLYAPGDTYWRDVGTPAEMARVHYDILDGVSPYGVPRGLVLDSTRRLVAPMSLGATALDGLGSHVWLGSEEVPEGVSMEDVVVLPGARLEANQRYEHMILTPWGDLYLD
jgi:mannose-1-phosphate guanylyltransferase